MKFLVLICICLFAQIICVKRSAKASKPLPHNLNGHTKPNVPSEKPGVPKAAPVKKELKNNFKNATKIMNSLKKVLRDTAAWKHHDYEEMTWLLKYYNNSCSPYSHLYSIGSTVQNRQLWVMALSTNPHIHEPGKPEVKFLGNIHGNDFGTREVLLHFIHFICEHVDKIPMINSLISNVRLHIMPSVNPDGYELARERQRPDRFTGRLNANGVDLNRNFPDQFFPATAELEPETNSLIKWMNTIPFVLSISMKEGALVASYPFDDSPSGQSKYSATPDDEVFRKLARVYAETHPTMHQTNSEKCTPSQHKRFVGGITNGAEWSALTNTMQDYNYVRTNCFEITVEISCQTNTSVQEIPQLFEENVKPMLEFTKEALKGVKGIVSDETGHPLAGARITVSDRRHDVITGIDGDFWRLLLPGSYELTASHKNYSTQSVSVVVKPGSEAVQVNFTLKRLGPDLSMITLGHVGNVKQSENAISFQSDGRDSQEVVISSSGIQTIDEGNSDKSRDGSSNDAKDLRASGEMNDGMSNFKNLHQKQSEISDNSTQPLDDMNFKNITFSATDSKPFDGPNSDNGQSDLDREEKFSSAESTSLNSKPGNLKTLENDTNFEVGSLLKCAVPGRSKDLYGQVRWIGHVPELHTRFSRKSRDDSTEDDGDVLSGTNSPSLVVGLELDYEDELGSDGTFLGHRYFKSEPGMAYFVAASMCTPVSDA